MSNNKKNYFIYDGRANYDIDSACVIERFEARNNHEAAKYHCRNYKGEDTVLCDSNDDIIY
jgi:hypothetical protein